MSGEIIAKSGFALPSGAGGKLTRISLQLDSGLPFEKWKEIGDALSHVEGSVMWWIGDWWAYGDHSYGERASQATGPDGFKFQTLMDAGWVARKIETSRRREVLPWSFHREVAAQEPAEQDSLLDWAQENGSTIKELRTEINRRKTIRRRESIELACADPSLPLGRKFPVVYADPPWRYENPPMGDTGRSIENHYPTMTLEEICALPVSEIIADDAILFMWATAPKLAECMQVVSAWGFEYRTEMVWVKDKIGMGYYVRNQHESLLICKRGNMPVPIPGEQPSSVLIAPRLEHSAKPPEIAEMIERLYPEMGRIELFCRAPREGWATWGNQAPSQYDGLDIPESLRRAPRAAAS